MHKGVQYLPVPDYFTEKPGCTCGRLFKKPERGNNTSSYQNSKMKQKHP